MPEIQDNQPPIPQQEGAPVTQKPIDRGGSWTRVLRKGYKRIVAGALAGVLGLGGAGVAVKGGHDGPPLPTPTGISVSGEEPSRSDAGANVRDAIHAHPATSGGEQTAEPSAH